MNYLYFQLEGPVRPFVRPNKMFTSGPAKENFEAFMANKRALTLQFLNICNLKDYAPIPAKTRFWVACGLGMEHAFKADLDNGLKTILDAASGAVTPDDRYCVDFTVRKLKSDRVIFVCGVADIVAWQGLYLEVIKELLDLDRGF